MNARSRSRRFLVTVALAAAALGALPAAAAEYLKGKGYEYYLTGNPGDAAPAVPPASRTTVVMGGGPDVDAAFRWMIAKGGGGDFVVLRVRGADGYNQYVYDMGGVDSVETLLVKTRDGVARAEAIYLQAVHRVAETAVNARTEVREAHARYAAAWELARRHRDQIVPMRDAIAREQLLRYNGMLSSVFDLMADAREQISAAQGYAEALRDFWIAEADLREALGGRLPMPVAPGAAPVAAGRVGPATRGG